MDLKECKVAVIATDGFEDSELRDPVSALKEAGAQLDIIAPKKGTIKGWKSGSWTQAITVDKSIDEVSAKDYDALLIPGGTLNCDKLRMCEDAVNFVKEMVESGKPTAAICHGPQMLIEADVVEGRQITSYQAIATDLKNAGAKWVDKQVVVDNGLVSSRTPEDLPQFINKMLEEFQEGIHP